VEAWSRPIESCPLVATRLAGAGNASTVNSNNVSWARFKECIVDIIGC
jgi:hypothetical protein